MQSEFKTLLSPFTIRGKTYRNRILTSPVNQPFYLENGGLSQEARLHLLEQARGGAAQVTIGEQPVDPSMGEGKTYDVLGERIPEPVERNLAPSPRSFWAFPKTACA